MIKAKLIFSLGVIYSPILERHCFIGKFQKKCFLSFLEGAICFSQQKRVTKLN